METPVADLKRLINVRELTPSCEASALPWRGQRAQIPIQLGLHVGNQLIVVQVLWPADREMGEALPDFRRELVLDVTPPWERTVHRRDTPSGQRPSSRCSHRTRCRTG